MSLKSRVKRLERAARGDGILLRLRDGSTRVFSWMEVQAALFLMKVDIFSHEEDRRKNPVLDAVRNATPESRAEFEERFGPITFTSHIISGREGWVESYTLTEAGSVERIRYEGGSEEARRVREGAQSGLFDEEMPLPRPPVAGQWFDEPIVEDLSEP